MEQTMHQRTEQGRVLSADQIRTLIVLERVGGSVSLVAVMLIFVAYALVKRVRNVQNTFIVFASVSNVGASIACIISMDGLFRGKMSPLCQAQSFMFEMFMQSDPWWSLAMAVNVYLVFYMRFDPNCFKRWWWLYCIICYGGPFTIAMTLLFIRDESRGGPVYGEAELWCWVDREWDFIRIYTYYMLIWMCILGSIICYVLVGFCVFRSRNRLRSLSTTRSRDDREPKTSTSHSESTNGRREGFYGTVITEVQVTHSNAFTAPFTMEPKQARRPEGTHVSFEEPPDQVQPMPGQYYSSVTSTPAPRTPRPTASRRIAAAVAAAANKFVIDDPIKRAYLRTSLLFALSVLVTWIPSSLNRIHSWLAGGSPFEYHVSTAAVLPLQGLWNAVIFFITSWSSLSNWYRGAHEERWEEVHDNPHNSNNNKRVEDGTFRRVTRHDDLAADSDLEAYSGTAGSDYTVPPAYPPVEEPPSRAHRSRQKHMRDPQADRRGLQPRKRHQAIGDGGHEDARGEVAPEDDAGVHVDGGAAGHGDVGAGEGGGLGDERVRRGVERVEARGEKPDEEGYERQAEVAARERVDDAAELAEDVLDVEAEGEDADGDEGCRDGVVEEEGAGLELVGHAAVDAKRRHHGNGEEPRTQQEGPDALGK
ncbi:hypothetical protein S40288_02530 [Stachybotrys chartarum IBT 40288]|nr:hypothetical protein S40288_02530 [Stachybotrys chartarum IBT 40288]